jgi:hypothetical protein
MLNEFIQPHQPQVERFFSSRIKRVCNEKIIFC